MGAWDYLYYPVVDSLPGTDAAQDQQPTNAYMGMYTHTHACTYTRTHARF